MKDYVIDHVVLVLGLVEAERAAEVLQVSRFGLAGGVARLYVHLHVFPYKKMRMQNVMWLQKFLPIKNTLQINFSSL